MAASWLRMSPSTIGVRTLASTSVMMLSFMRPASTSLMGGMRRPSPYTSRLSGQNPAGVIPPMSA